MDTALQELPLALFTTLAPMGAGAFVMLCVAFLRGRFTGAQFRAVDRFTVVPLALAVVGMLCSFAHLANPGNVLYVMDTIGATPLANEVTAFGAFCLLALLYWIAAVAGGLKRMGVRRAFSVIVALAALVFMAFAGLAYWIPTVPLWDSAFSPMMTLGIGLFGGMVCGMVVLALAGADGGLDRGGADNMVVGLFFLGAILLLASLVFLWAASSGMHPALFDISARMGSLMPAFAASIVLVVVALALGFFCMKVAPSAGYLACTLVVVIAACFLARLVFYGLQIGVGL